MLHQATDLTGQTGLDSLAWLIDPVSTTDFEQHFYEQQLCLVQRAIPSYYRKLLSSRDLDNVLGTHDLRHPEISLARGEDTVPRPSYAHASGRVDPLEVTKRFDEGATIIFNSLHRRVPSLARLCVALGNIFGSRIQTNIYLTPPEAQGFKPHWDTHDVFVLQVYGHKVWSVYDSPISLPLKGQGFDPDRDTPGPISEQFELGPGSVIYVPRGLMHSARSTNEISLHITLGLTAFTWIDLILESAAAASLENPSLRQNLPIGFASGRISADEKTRLYREKLDLLQTQFNPAPVWRHFQDEVMATNTPLFTDLLGMRLQADPLTLDTMVNPRRDLVVKIESDGEKTVVRCRGQEITLPAHALPAVKFATSTPTFKVRELPDCLTTEGKVTLVTRLVKEGLLLPQGSGTGE